MTSPFCFRFAAALLLLLTLCCQDCKAKCSCRLRGTSVHCNGQTSVLALARACQQPGKVASVVIRNAEFGCLNFSALFPNLNSISLFEEADACGCNFCSLITEADPPCLSCALAQTSPPPTAASSVPVPPESPPPLLPSSSATPFPLLPPPPASNDDGFSHSDHRQELSTRGRHDSTTFSASATFPSSIALSFAYSTTSAANQLDFESSRQQHRKATSIASAPSTFPPSPPPVLLPLPTTTALSSNDAGNDTNRTGPLAPPPPAVHHCPKRFGLLDPFSSDSWQQQPFLSLVMLFNYICTAVLAIMLLRKLIADMLTAPKS